MKQIRNFVNLRKQMRSTHYTINDLIFSSFHTEMFEPFNCISEFEICFFFVQMKLMKMCLMN